MKKTIYQILCAPIVGRLLYTFFRGRLINLRHPGYRFWIPHKYTSDEIHASIFWGFYESAELRLVKKYLPSHLPVIELGGSLGVVSSIITSKIKSSLTIVEANPFLINSISQNVNKHNRNNIPVRIINKAVSYKNDKVSFSISKNNTESSIIDTDSETHADYVTVDPVTLFEIADRMTEFVLVCDIEGMEWELVRNDSVALEKCKHLFMEIHDYMTPNHLLNKEALFGMLKDQGFILAARDGNILYMLKGE